MVTESNETGNLEKIKQKILVLSGKGGVGKSTVSAHLALSLARRGLKTGLMDVDLHGPSITRMFELKNFQVGVSEDGTPRPVEVAPNLKVVSIGMILESENDAVIWRGPMKYGVIKQFLQEVDWGELDCLVIDSPPGTGDEPLSVAQLAGKNSSALVITTPQQIALSDVRRSITFCKKLNLPIIGIIENMSGFTCPHCGGRTDLFSSGGGEKLAAETGVPFLGGVPFDPGIVVCGDSGKGFSEDLPGEIMPRIMNFLNFKNNKPEEVKKMKIAIPTAGKQLCMHFGHCDEFALVEIDETTKKASNVEYLVPPPHEPGVLPKWLNEQGANVIIAGGMGQRAQGLFAQNGISVVVGAQGGSPEELAEAYIAQTLQTGSNVCDH